MIEIFSPNMLKTYKQCPRKFYWQYIEHISVPKSTTPFEKGKKIHALANYFLRNINISRIETALSEEEKETWQTLLNNPFFQKECLYSEYNLSCKIGNYWIGGRLDAVFKEFEDYYILDYKTGSTPKDAEYDFQTMVYLLALDKKLKNYNSLSFVYVNLKTKTNHIIKFNPQLRVEYETKIKEICEEITNDTLHCSNNNECLKCEYYNHVCSGENHLP